LASLTEGVQFLTECLVPFACLVIFQRRKGIQVGILRMQRKDADAAIGIGVGPSVGGSRVIDGQYLQHPLAGLGHEVYHLFQVSEVAHAETVF